MNDPNSRIIAIRGTEGAVEWLNDAAAIPVPFRQVPSARRVAQGFDKIYDTLKVVKRRLPKDPPPAAGAEPETFSGSFAEQLAISREAVRGSGPPSTAGRVRPQRSAIVAGHSLGAALATLFVMENDSKGKFDITTLCTFASPRVGSMEFVHLFNQLSIVSWPIVNTRDVVPKLPPHIPILLDYGHVHDEYAFNSSGFAKNNLLCWHTMETYLHWLDSRNSLLPECVPSALAGPGVNRFFLMRGAGFSLWGFVLARSKNPQAEACATKTTGGLGLPVLSDRILVVNSIVAEPCCDPWTVLK